MTVKQKICAVPAPWRNPDNISVSMEAQPLLGENQFKIGVDCFGCEKACAFHFMTQGRLSFAAVGKLASVFSLPCKKLAAKAVPKETGQLKLDGLPSPTSAANKEKK